MIHATPRAGRQWPPVRSFDPWELFLELSRTARRPLYATRMGQRQQLVDLVMHAKSFVPYYQASLADVDVKELDLKELRTLPILSRATLRAREPEFTPRRLPPGMTLAGGAHTSGTTGEPVHVNYTSAQRAWYAAHLLRALDWAGFQQNRKLAAIRYIDVPDVPEETRAEVQAAYMAGVELPRWDPSLATIVETGPAFGMVIEQDPRVQYQWLKRIEPDYLVSHGSNLLHLSALCRRHGPILSLRAVMSMAEQVTEEERDQIEQGFSVELFDVYSCREVGYVASQCKCGLYHVYDENVIVEVLDDDDRPCLPGETGRVVLTGLHTYATPLIRYDIGDRARLVTTEADADCRHVEGLSSLLSIEGRQLPPFLMLDGSRKDSMRLSSLVRQAAQGEVSQYSIEQTAPDEVVVSAVPGSEALDVPRYTVAVTQAVWEFFGSREVRVKTNLCPRLPLGPSGKAPPVLSCRV